MDLHGLGALRLEDRTPPDQERLPVWEPLI